MVITWIEEQKREILDEYIPLTRGLNANLIFPPVEILFRLCHRRPYDNAQSGFVAVNKTYSVNALLYAG